MAGYFGPRACIALGIDCPGILSSTKDPILADNLVSLSPNPTANAIKIESAPNRTIEEIVLFSIEGRALRTFQVNSNIFQKDDLNLAPGMYIALVRFEDGVVPKKFILR